MCTLISAMCRSHIPPPAICRTRRNAIESDTDVFFASAYIQIMQF
jgi:hypothetical protein